MNGRLKPSEKCLGSLNSQTICITVNSVEIRTSVKRWGDDALPGIVEIARMARNEVVERRGVDALKMCAMKRIWKRYGSRFHRHMVIMRPVQ